MASAVQENYFDLAGLNKIKLQAKTDSKEALKAVASEFESIFLKMMLKSMREANMGNPLFDSDSAKFYREMYDDQLALNLSKQGGIGLADTLIKQLERYLPQEQIEKEAALSNKEAENNKPIDIKSMDVKINDFQINDVKNTDFKKSVFNSPNDFVNKLLPHAEVAAKEIGVEPKVLLAQAALETGWGKYVVQSDNGKSSHNLFNIKADNRWGGEDASISTIEFIGNRPQTRQANFRVYDSYEESFQDYVKFLKESPRYSDALNNSHDASAFTNSLQQAGYATDPSYAKKIQRIMQDRPLNDALDNIQMNSNQNILQSVGF